jgi:hypothetical protein
MSQFDGRWDLQVGTGSDGYPSWVEFSGAEGRFVGRWGSARPIASVGIDGDTITWRLPKQYEARESDLVFAGQMDGDTIRGTTTTDDGVETAWVAHRAPSLERNNNPVWGESIDLIGDDLSNWQPRTPSWKSHWSIADGMLVNAEVGSDLLTTDRYMDFRLEAEYSYPKGSNSGIYLRGRYEVQIIDDHGAGPSAGASGAIYGFLVPSENAVLPHGEWNRAVITLLGRHVTIELNGKTVVDGEIPGITGGALDCAEGEPGPIFLQGDHGPVTFRLLRLTPANP